MKQTSLLFASFLFFFVVEANARLCTATSNGNWSDPATWDCGTAPTDNDTMWTPLGFTVTVDINSPEYQNMLVIVDGVLNFDNGQKINICPGGVYVSATGELSGGNPGSKIDICGSTAWNGPGPTFGPLFLGLAILPVELISFTGNAETTGNIVLNWSTATETNNSHFCIERSINGLTVTEIGRINGHGTATQVNQYSFNEPGPESGTIYYRLKQVDFNGRFEYLGVVSVEKYANSPGCVLSVYPNPCEGSCTVNFSDCPEDNTGYISLQMLDAEGRVVNEQIPERNANGGFSTIIDVENNVKPGAYIVRGSSSRKTYTQRAVIK